jgi:DinB superfamily
MNGVTLISFIFLPLKLCDMKKFFSLLSLLILLGFTTTGDKLSKEDKKNAINYFKQTQQDLAKEIKGLSETQLNWKPADSVWSVANCVEHIALSEKNLFDWAMGTLKEPANPAKRSELKVNDEQIKQMITDRTHKVKTREGFIPTGQFGNTAQTFAVFKERRAASIKYIKTTEDDLRNHFAETPLGLIDTYQLMIFLSAHTKRHTLQIAELKANPDFPKQ